jgi:hypothetical protein
MYIKAVTYMKSKSRYERHLFNNNKYVTVLIIVIRGAQYNLIRGHDAAVDRTFSTLGATGRFSRTHPDLTA